MTAQRPCQRPSSPAALQQDATEPSITMLPRTRFHRRVKFWVLWEVVQTAFLLVAACWLCACFSTAPPSARRGRAESHQWTRTAVAFPTSARSLYKPARTDRRSLWMSPPSHKALRAPTTTAPPEYEESGPALIG